ncbi:GntR family transcriptional regulator [Algimonas porphyrae]|uniref:GntR family transcriptional regulator n=2 Tax=Algimonas porphyrae TaxID=1128113 RepID=A0ABQ5V2T9_9PROT|nr:GntR family transcriptional regulator [Algimonas porphyrae]GLQ21385.1 GntR family transcriptional regulator [Algimonas porphyrae]
MNASRPLPRHIQISERLIREIASGLLSDGTRLPPERQMAQNFGVAIGTLRKALAALEDKGLLERKQGSGNYVRRQSAVKSVYSQFHLERPEGGGLPTAMILSLQTVDAPVEAARFGLPSRLLRIERQRALDDRPVAFERIWIAPPDASVSAAAISDSLYAWYRDALGLIIARVEDKVGVAPFPDGVRLNALPTGQAVGFIERRAWDQMGQTAEYSQTWFDPDRARFFSRSEDKTG